MNDTQAKKLREPFPAAVIGKLPRVTCKACSENKFQKHCDKHVRKECPDCKNFITTAHIHLDYVGHAATTDRLLQVDPSWTWEPMAVGPNGEPLMTNGGLWIRLTVAGVSRPGFGDGANAKEVISDAIRNAAMRFGVALDLWAKQDLHADEQEEEAPAPEQPKPRLSVEMLAEFTRVAEAWQAIDSTFDAAAALKEARKHDDAWVTVAKAKLQGYISEALDSDSAQATLEASAA